jgi:hypothetical protein
MMHTIRLLQVAEEIGLEGRLNVKRHNREQLLAIKRGEFNYDELLVMADKLSNKIETSFAKSQLLECVDLQKVESILVDIRNQLYHKKN